VSWVVAQLVSSLVVGALGSGADVADVSIGVMGAALGAAWVCYLLGMWVASDRAGTGNFLVDYGVSFRAIDAVGFGIGALSQLVVVNLVYLPLRSLWPDVFTDDRLQENAKDLIDRASGGSAVLLVVLVALGAPIIEELFYRGLLQRSLLARYNDGIVVVGVVMLFALVHFRVVEYPGLFVFALILGFCAMRTGRLGMSITTHIGFNLTGLILAW
jgi:membrane protease YdiL (CAAX protease family)